MIDLIDGNPVDLEFDHNGRFSVDESDALEILGAHCGFTIINIGSSKPTGKGLLANRSDRCSGSIHSARPVLRRPLDRIGHPGKLDGD